MDTLAVRIRQNAERQPAAPFCTVIVRNETRSITFRELYRGGCAYATIFVERGVKPGDIVPIILPHGPHLFFAFVGAVLAGAVPSFLPFPSAKQRADIYWADHAKLFGRIQPRLLVSFEENIAAAVSAMPEFAIDTLVADDSILAAAERDAAFAGFDAGLDDIACLQHSSGTTGLKKGVMLSHRAIMQHARTYCAALSFTAQDVIVSWLPLYHDMGFVACFLISLIEATHLIALDPFEWVVRPAMLLEIISQYRATLCWLPNFAFAHLVNTAKPAATYDLSSIRSFINCSEPCRPETFDRFVSRFSACGVNSERLQVCYAMAENVFAVTQTTPGTVATVIEVDPAAFSRGVVQSPISDAKRLLSCGSALAGVELMIRDLDGKECHPETIGEVWLKSNYLFTGYYLQPEVTAQRKFDGWFKTGDTGFLRGGELYITGRIDDMIIVHGRNYFAHEIEAIVNEIAGVVPGRSVAIGIDDPRTDSGVVVVLAECRTDVPGRDSIGQDIRRCIQDHLGIALHAVVALPRGTLVKTTSGKISRAENKKRYLEKSLPELVG